MKDREAGEVFDAGFNCAQSVFVPFARDTDLPEKEAFLLASVFGGGMGKMQLTCGAVTGAFMALGLHYGFATSDNKDQRAVVLAKTRLFVAEFTKRFGSISCKELLGYDLNSDEGQRRHLEENQRELICKRCVEGAAQIVETMTRE